MFFQEPKWAGEQHQFVGVGEARGTNLTGGRSAILGENLWAKVVVAGEEMVVRGGGGVRDFQKTPWGLKSKDFEKVEVKEVQSGELRRRATFSFCSLVSFELIFFFAFGSGCVRRPLFVALLIGRIVRRYDWIEHERELCMQTWVRGRVVREVQDGLLWIELLSWVVAFSSPHRIIM